ncbi:tripartite tricarboxylate transporter substrate binding protein [Bordetella sp. N]|uniref:Bug family tripartite tricarboxylate transporter substrate binding protein n=1 Tax=Bordetella sp. N TaxID=1746199 RepID=UPI000A9194D8|nr:tripartite tricarboxylate transporter substrate-binding protein [Bordetella sp. N]
MQFDDPRAPATQLASNVVSLRSYSSRALDAYPSQRITLVVGGSPGAGVDIIARHIAMELEHELATKVQVENRPGDSGNIAAEHVARCRPDGYTLFVSARPNVAYGALQANPRYDLRRELQPIGLMASAPSVVIAGKDALITSARELATWAKDYPMSIRCASGGVGSTGHLLCEEFQQEANVELMHVPYIYADQAFSHAIGGYVDTVFITLSAALPYLRADAVQAIAVSGQERAPSAPTIPTFHEQGYVDLRGNAWYGLMAPIATRPEIAQRLNTSLNRVLSRRQLREQLHGLGYILPSELNSADALRQLIEEEAVHWADVGTDHWSPAPRH